MGAQQQFKFHGENGQKIGSNVNIDFPNSKVQLNEDRLSHLVCSSSSVSVDYDLILPQLTNIKKFSKDEQKEWNRYIDASKTYQKALVDIIHQFYDDLIKKVKGKTVQDANKIIDQIPDDIKKAAIEYRQSTNDGATLGAVLNINIGLQGGISILEGASIQGNPNYDPQILSVKKGITLTVINRDSFPHTLTNGANEQDPNNGKLFDTGIIGPTKIVNIPTSNLSIGRYAFHCSIHPFMTGTLELD